MKPFWKTVLLTGLLVGTLDISAAYINQFIKTGKFAGKMFQYIAGGALGLENSIPGGFWIGLLGFFFHYFIAFSFTLLFFVAYPRLKFLSFNKYLVGFLYGIFVGAFMTFVVLPLTKLPDNPFVFQKAIVGWLILAVAVGIPVAISASGYYNIHHDQTK
jgi:hypothetical protein